MGGIKPGTVDSPGYIHTHTYVQKYKYTHTQVLLYLASFAHNCDLRSVRVVEYTIHSFFIAEWYSIIVNSSFLNVNSVVLDCTTWLL